MVISLVSTHIFPIFQVQTCAVDIHFLKELGCWTVFGLYLYSEAGFANCKEMICCYEKHLVQDYNCVLYTSAIAKQRDLTAVFMTKCVWISRYIMMIETILYINLSIYFAEGHGSIGTE
jgi:hypothetical protein